MKTIKLAILGLLKNGQKMHKFNLIGRPYQRGPLEEQLGLTFAPSQRATAAAAFDSLVSDGYIRPTYTDVTDPENWVAIADAGLQAFELNLNDAVDGHLAKIAEHLVEMRAGMHDAAIRTSPDAPKTGHKLRKGVDRPGTQRGNTSRFNDTKRTHKIPDAILASRCKALRLRQ